ncbi:MAG: hypothetical protein JF625_17255 [Inquilinus limosus]|uniref:Uncharacterized protein n=1 Tax=Inquilinus limosus TaxID=171674 RepID=A0A952KLP9_9PROT|nr:hypothetical protein [Inquilinus limosus]
MDAGVGRILILLLMLLGCAGPTPKLPTPDGIAPIATGEPTPPSGDPLLRNRISKGLAYGGRLWLTGGSGALVSFGLSDGSRQMHFADQVVDLAASDRGLWVLRSTALRPSADYPGAAGGTYVVSSWTGSSFRDSPPFNLPEMPLAVIANGPAPLVLSPHTLLSQISDRGNWRQRPLHGELRGSFLAPPVVLGMGDLVYIGHNRGEWGGGLQVLNLATDIVSEVDQRDGRGLCDGPLNGDCDPVTGLVPATDEPGCIVASVGLIHMDAHGRILKICSRKVSTLFEKIHTEEWNGRSIETSEPFYGLTAAKPRGFWAVAPGTLYRFEGKTPTSLSLPNPTQLGGLWINRDQPGLLILYTEVNRAVSLSGVTPLLIPLE